MSGMGVAARLRATAAGLAMAVLAGGACTSVPPDSMSPTATSADTTTVVSLGAAGGEVRLDEHVTLIAAAGAVAADTKFELAGMVEPSGGIATVGTNTTIADIRVVSGAVNQPVSVVFQTERPVDSIDVPGAPAEDLEPVPVGLHRDAGEWTVVPASWDPTTRSVAVETPGFSPIGFTWLTPAAIMREGEDLWNTMTADLFASANVKCDGEDRARAAGWDARSTSGEQVKWCLGLDGDKPVLKIANNRRYPRLFTVHGAASVDAPDRSLSSKVGSVLNNPNQYVVDPTKELALTLGIPPGYRATTRSEFDGLSMSIMALDLGLELSGKILEKMGAKAGVNLLALDNDLCLKAISDAASDGDRLGTGSIFKLKGCVDDALRKLPGIAGKVLGTAVGLIFATVAFFWGSADAIEAIRRRDNYEITVAHGNPTTSTRPETRADCSLTAIRAAVASVKGPDGFRCWGSAASVYSDSDWVTILWRNGRWERVARKESADNTISVEGFGSLKMHSTLADAVAAGRTISGACGSFAGIRGGPSGLLVTADEQSGEISSITSTDPGFETLSGITIGSSDSQVRAAYGTNLHETTVGDYTLQTPALILRSPQAEAAHTYVWFIMQEGTVHSISLVPAGTEPQFC